MTGPSDTDGFDNREFPDGTLVDVPVIMMIMPLVHKVIEEPTKLVECLTTWTVSCSVRQTRSLLNKSPVPSSR